MGDQGSGEVMCFVHLVICMYDMGKQVRSICTNLYTCGDVLGLTGFDIDITGSSSYDIGYLVDFFLLSNY